MIRALLQGVGLTVYFSLFTIHSSFTFHSSLSSQSGFVELFNGKDLSGWVNVNCAPETWSVSNGEIVCTGKPTGVLRTERQYQNYILELEWMHLQEGGNAGLFLHSDAITARGQPFTRSIEVQILDGNHGDIFSIHGASLTPVRPHPRGWSRALPLEKRAHPTGEWNHYRIESRDGVITLSVNGPVVTQAVNANPRKGYICLESEGSPVRFRNIRIQELPADEPSAEVVARQSEGFRSLYNGIDLRGWRRTRGNEGHWRVNDWMLEYDGKSEAEGENRHLWTDEEYEDFSLIVDWRQTAEATLDEVPHILPDGTYATNPDGSRLTVTVPDAGDSGILLRGTPKAQINIWNWPIGSGEVWGYRTDSDTPPEVRRAVTPIRKADRAIGEWNRFEIEMVGDRLTVHLNGQLVIDRARLPGVPPRGPIGLQHHGDPIQFANIYIKEITP
ncbi:MAG: 3-keto-disaccharide hydrolase [Acidobacteriota bacterium]